MAFLATTFLACGGAFAEVLTGSYTGDGSDNRAITGVGFQPDVVIIKAATAQTSVIRSSSMSGDASKQMEGSGAHVADRIQSLDADGFTVGTNAEVNGNATTYHWIAFKVQSGSMSVGTYTGNGTGQSFTGLGFGPELVFVWNASTTQAVFRSAPMTTSYDFAGGAPNSNRITSLDGDGFTVGTSTRTNGNGSTYYYVAWNEVSGVTKSGSYTGNGTDDHSVTGVGFQPEYVIVKGTNSGGNYWTEQKPASTGDSTDAALEFGAWAVETGEIKALESDGFKVGTSNETNQNAETYAYFAWVQQSSAPTISDIASQSTNISTATGAIAFTVGDADVSASVLTVTASSSNTTLLPNGNITLGGSGANRTITLTPATGQTGTSTVTVTVSDGELTTSDTFVLGVTTPTQAVQSGTATIAASSTSTTATITQVNLNRTYLLFSATVDDTNPGNASVRGELTDPTTVTFTRYGSTGSVTITWSVVEYASGITVQRGVSTTMGGAATNNVTIASVNTSKAFPLITWSVDGVVFSGNDYMKAKLTSSTNLEVSSTTAGGSNQIVSWQVVEYTNGASVQTGDVSFLTTDSSKTATVTSVNTSKSWLLYTHTSTDGTGADIGQKLIRGEVTNATTLTFDRTNTGQTSDLTWYLVEFTDNHTVQKGTQAFSTSETEKDVTITSVDTAKSFAAGGGWQRTGKSSYSTDDNPGVGWFTQSLTSSTNLRLTRALTGTSTADVGWFVVTIPTPGITVSPTSGLTTTEASGTATFTVVLNTQPTASVSVGISSSDTTEGTVSTSGLTFTTANWGTAQTVTVTGANDSLDDGNVGYSVVTAAATSTDVTYSGIDASDVTVTTTDDDTSGFTVSSISGTTTEAGGTATFTVVLTAQPTASVSVGVSSADTTEGTVSPSSLTFTTGNWNTAQTVTLTGVDDTLDDGDVAYTITTAAATSSDGNYNGVNPSDVSVTNTDNDASGFTVSAISGATTEAGGTATFTVVLTAEPTASVSVGVSSADTTEGTVSPSSLTFTTNNWNAAQTVTVTGVDDSLDDGDVAYTITTAAATSSDGNYNGVNPSDVSVTNTDNDASGFTVSAISGTTTEAGGTATFTVVLTAQPTASVSVGVSSADTTEGTVSPSSLTFTTGNWNTAQTVTVTGADDSLDDGDVAYTITTAAATSSDGNYNGLNPSDVSATNTDNDASGFTVSAISGPTTEAGGTATFTVVLTAQPTASVSVGVSSSDTTEGTVSTASLTFSTSNWNSAQTVTVTGVDDTLDDGDVAYTITTAAATSSDGNYNGVNPSDVSVTNTDNDASGFTVSAISGTTTEAGGTATFTVVLTAQPTASVSVGVSSADTTEGTVSPSSLTFTTGNWNTAQTVTVTGVDDTLDDGDVAYTITTAAATSSDGNYNGVNPSDVSATNTDNDASGFTVSAISGPTTEAGGTATFTVVLTAQPTASVSVGVSSSDTTEGTVSTASLTFSTSNWNSAQTVTVTGVDDTLDDGDVAYTITTAAATSSDGNYNGVNPSDVSVTNTDNDASGFTVSAISGTTTEAGGAATFTVVLTAQPTASVNVGVSSADTTEGTVSPSSLTFTTGNWDTAQTVTVTGVDDTLDDGDVAYTITTAAATSSDGNYNGVNPSDVSVTNTDNDASGFTVSAISGTTTEAGGTATFTVVLTAQPTASVSVGISSSDTTEGTVSTASLTFSTSNWNSAQTVTVTGVDDTLDDGDVAYTITTAAATSSDGNYNGVNPSDVSATNTDNDTSGFTVSAISGATTEAGGTATFTVVLTAQPTASVSVGVSSADTTEGTVSPSSLTFTTGNWNTAQTVTVTGVDDTLDDGDVAYTITTAAATSSDGNYNGVNPSDVSATNTDDDASGFTVSAISGTTTEAGGTATFTVVLTAQPTASVSVGVSSTDTSEGTVSPSSLTFTTGNWNTAQTVTVTGVDDSLDDGDVAYTITTAAATSSDGNYNGVNPNDVSATNTDNDASGFTVSTISGSTTEAGGSATFTVVLTAQPTAGVTVGVSSADTTEGTVSPSSLTFTTGNWDTAQTVTVTGVDDTLDDGNVAYTITTAAATSSDGNYNGVNPSDVSATNTDNDASGFTVSAISGATTEAGGTATFTVVLTAQPTASVSVGVSSTDTTEGTVSPSSLTFTTGNWNTAQTVTVTGVDDSLDDGNVAYTITTAAATSSDGNYNGVNPSDVSATNTDNDASGFTVSAISGTTTEAGGTATFTVVLTAEPTANVSVGISSADTTEGTVSAATITFTTLNWNAAQTVTVTGADDTLDDGDVAYTIVSAAATSSDGTYNGVNPDDVAVTNTDNDTSAVTITPTSGLTTTEAGGTATFTAVLTAQPTADVSVGISSSDTTEGTVSPSTLTFTSGNWDTAQTVTVTGVDDVGQDGNIAYTVVTASASSSDSNYNGVNPSDVSVSNADDDVAGIAVTPTSGLSTTEGGGTSTFTVVLTTQPTADVTVGISSSDTTEGTVSAATLTFTTGNWNAAQTVTVTGVDDSLDDGDIAYTIATSAASSSDGNYSGMNPADVSVTNTDNDVSGFTVSAISGNTTEAAGTATFTVVLTAQPTADVSAGISSSDTTEGTVSAATLTFTSVNWNSAQTVTVTGADDSLDDGDIAYTITTAAASSSDPNYNGVNAADVAATNADNDTAGITVSAISGTTTEAGGTATFTAVLTAQPTADVVLGIASADTTEGTVSASVLTFTSGTWNTAQTVTVTGVDDSLDDGDIAYTITTAAALSTDSTFDGLNPGDVSATNTDDDASAITVSAISGATTEAGGTATFTVVLTAQPTADVVVGVSSSDTTEGTVSASSLTFTSGTWNAAQTVTVTGVDDSLDDGDIAYTITTAVATSSDGNYNGLNPTDVSATNTDDDTSAITVSAISGATTEAGGTATFTLVLAAQPTADVAVGIASSDTTEGTVSAATLTFTSTNWNAVQTVTVTGVDDSLDDGDIAFTITTAAATSSDGNYNGVNPNDVSATNTDNDTSGFTVSAISGATSEAGGTATFTVVLTAQPTADVAVGIASSDTTEGTVSAVTLTFTSANWNTVQTVTVTGVDDSLDDGDIAFTITTAAASSSDGNYSGVNPSDVSVTNTDNDTASITVSAISGATSEAGGAATFTVVLTSQPTADVAVGIASNDTTEGTVSAATLTFTSANWNTVQTVTVTGVDDSLDDGDIAFTITTAAASSSDGNYSGVNPSDVAVTNTDNDTASITVSAISGATSEAGGTATFTVVLTSQPTADVTVGIASSDTTEGTVSASSVTFTAGNWNTVQTVTVTGVDDSLDDGDIAYTITTAAASSSDSNYNGVNPTDVSATNTDNDASAITVSAISGTTTEAGGTATFTVVLTAQPTADVAVGIASSDTTEGTVSASSLTFTSGNWNTVQTVTVTGVDDSLDDGDIAYTITTAAASSSDSNYNGVNPTDVSATNTDDDASTITVSAISGATTEAGGTATFTVVLTAQPTADVAVGIASSDTTEGTVSASSLTFTSGNWNTVQTVTVTGVDDSLDDGDIAYTITTAAASSSDSNYNGVNPTDVSATNTDNDASAITVSAISGTTTEAGGTATFTVVLTAQPTADVAVGIASSDTTEGTVSAGTLTFTAANWNTVQTVTVTGVDDSLDDGDIAFTITTAAASSSDSNYNGLNPGDVSVTNTDNDTASITVSAISGTTSEAGGTATFTVVLTSQPTADVAVGIASSDTTEGTVSTASLTFTSGNWNAAQTVTVTGVDDSLDDGDIAFTITTAAASSSDGNYSGANPSDVAVTNTDNDTASITVSAISGTTSEAGGAATFTVVLTAQPTADVAVGIASSDATEGTVSAATLTFTSGNWNAAQTVTVTGVDDSLDDGDIAFTITTAAASSSDGNYSGVNPGDVAVTNTDNDTAGITVSAISGSTSEAGGTATFTVVLTSQPTADVTVGIASSDTTEGTVSAATLTFTSGNWAVAQTVTVTGADDSLDDGDIAFTITTAAASSSDPNYNSLNPTDVSATNTDNDASAITVSAISGATSEAGGTATFTVVLTAQPTADVVIGVSSSDTTEGTVSASSLTFTSGTWSAAQTVTVTGVDDSLDDGDIAFTITTAAASSGDPNYNGQNPTDVSATNADNDTSGITISAISGNTTEAGGAATFTVVLTAQPTADVSVGLSSSDATEGSVSPSSVTFTSATWNTVQTVTVTGVNDSLDDGNVTFTIVTGAATSGDTGFDTINPSDVSVTNVDDDAAGITVSTISGPTSEGGGTATFTVVLTAQPTADVTIGLASSDTTEGTVAALLTFTSANWAAVQTVTVTGVDDNLDDSNVNYTIVTAAASSSDAAFNTIDPSDVAVTNADDDTSGITVTPTTGLTTTEGGGTATFSLVLTAQPTASVSVSLASSDTSEGTVSASSLTFTTANWSAAQTVTLTGVDDAVQDGSIAFTIVTGAAASADGNYSGMDPSDVSASNADNDVAGIAVTPTSGLSTTEAGGTTTFTVVLTTQPVADVAMSVASSDTSEATVSATTLTFTSLNWNTAQTVTVTGVDDSVDDGDVNLTIVTGVATSADPNYSGLDPSDAAVTNTDNDTTGITVTPSSGLVTSELGAATTFTVVLTSQPTADVTMGLVSNDASEGTASVSSLTFTSLNWSTPRTVTVTGVDDSLDDGDVAYAIVTAAATSGDATYGGVDAADVSLTNADNDTSGFTVAPTSGLVTTEAGGTATFSVVLTAQPLADVSVGLSSSDTSEGDVSSSSLTFTTANWNTAQTVTVTGADDFGNDNDVAYTVTTTPATSADGQYHALDAADVTLTNLDDDPPGITVTPGSGLTTTEAGGTATFTVTLQSMPTADVVIGVSSADTSEGTASPASLTFSTATWNIAQTVTVAGVDDSLDDGDVTHTIVTAAAASADLDYNGFNPADVGVTNTDDDVVGITVSPTTGLSTTEAGGTATFTVVLTAQPTADVAMSVVSSDTTEATASASSLTFTSANWNTAQTVTVTGVGDSLDDGDVAYTIVTGTVSSADGLYAGMNPSDVTGTTSDDDASGIVLTPTSGLTTTETGGTHAFTVVLSAQPVADVSVGLSSSDMTEGTVSVSSVTFTSANWSTAQTVTVTGVDDSLDDGDIAFSVVTAAATSPDPNYGSLNPVDVSVANTDNDVSGFTVTPSTGTTSEAGGTMSFGVALTAQPTADVSVAISSTDTTEGTVSASSLTFTSVNWSTAQTVTVTGVDDSVDDGDVAYSAAVAAATSADTNYAGIDPADVSVTNSDDDTAGVTVTPTSGLITTEAGGSATFTVVLTSQPTADVTVGVSSNDTTEGTVSASVLTFTAANWSTVQTVTVTGADDDVDDGDVALSVVTAAVTSADGSFSGLDPGDVAVTNTDDDAVGVSVTPTSGLTTSESGSTATFTVSLTSQPASDVVIPLSSSDTNEATVGTSALTFTAANWSTAQTVTVTGGDDPVDDGDMAVSIVTGAAASGDAAYNGVDASDVSVTNTDDDASAFAITPFTGLTTSEAGGTATFTVRLTSQPGADVFLGLASSDTTEATVLPAALTFTSANWATEQTVTVTGVDDPTDDGTVAYAIVTEAAVSADAAYDELDPSDLGGANADDDTAGFVVTPASGLTTNEAGSATTFTIRLTSQPSADVAIAAASDDATEGTVSPAALTFTSSNWGTAQTVTVTGVDDAVKDGDTAYSVVTSAVSADSSYGGATVPDVAVTNADDEPDTVPITGVLTHGGQPLEAVTISLAGTVSATTVSAADGTYRFDVPYDSDVVVTPDDPMYEFTPASLTLSHVVAGVTADFTAARVLMLSGRVSDGLGGGIADVVVTLSGDTSGSATTDAAGSYVFSVVEGRQYTVSVSRTDFVFSPSTRSVGPLTDDTTADFTATSGLFPRYFAEGATGGFFDTQLALLNPTSVPANVTLRFLKAGGEVVTRTLTVPATTRATVEPERLAGLASAEFSTVIESDQPVAVDRTMAWDNRGYGAHAETSILAPRVTWYFAEGATVGGFNLFYLLQNPNTSDAEVSIRYLLPAPQAAVVKTYVVAAQSRLTIWANQEHPALAQAEMSAVVTATNGVPIIAERAMYLDVGGQVFGAGSEGAGLVAPATQWFLAEGATGPYFDCFVLIGNPSGTAADVRAEYLLPGGMTVTKTYTVAAASRFNIWVDFEDALLANTAVSTRVTSTNGVPIVVERAMWWPGDGWLEGHGSGATTQSGTKWVLAEGESGGARAKETYVLVANTSSRGGDVRVSVMLEDGSVHEQTYSLPASSRFTIPVGVFFPVASAGRYGVVVEAIGTDPIDLVVERAMYWDAVDSRGVRVHWAAGTDALGSRIK